MSSPKSSPPPGSPPKSGAGSPAKSGAATPQKSGTGSPAREGSPTKGSREKQKSKNSQGEPEQVRRENLPLRKVESEGFYSRPDFIYGGPFIAVKLPSPFLDTATPMNLPLQGTFKKSFAYFSLKDRLPVILTKIIDHLSRDGDKIRSANSASSEDVNSFMQAVAKLKNDLVTNKSYDPLTVDTPEAKKWNEWIANQEHDKYFNNIWLFSECYVYRRLKEACELTKGLSDFDYFEAQKNQAFDQNVELMCIVADRMVNMIVKSEKDKRKNDFITLLKICLWANKADLSLSLGDPVSLADQDKEKPKIVAPPAAPAGKKGKAKAEAPPPAPLYAYDLDPFQVILESKDKILVDDTPKIADQLCAKAEAMNKAVEGIPPPPAEPPAPPAPPAAPAPAEGAAPVEGEAAAKPEAPKQIPCPAKMTIPQAVMFDIVCDNAGYELFADLCLAHFLIAQKIVKKVRFHVKNMPWFVSDVTIKDFSYVINACMNSKFEKEIPLTAAGAAAAAASQPPPAAGEEASAPGPKILTAENLRTIATQWDQYFKDGVFVVMAEDYWTYPHPFKDMKKYDYNMYRKLQYAVAVLFKGDLNYRKLLGERNCNPTTTFEQALQGFTPAPLIAVRTVKSELICGLPKGKWDQLTSLDEKWMQSGDYGVIQYYPKGEALKVADRPCMDYCTTCFGVICPEHTDI
ncbi:unnamed protein product [Chrysodeixis includens]|uniref:Damage-control phosphatase ARMT1 n=1 Tax=Chrysodeixis includens TaxID=689277 RepID=A0A9P0FX72_CHRIL|nr:unnamed protein product [Chrysodeixis includens]